MRYFYFQRLLDTGQLATGIEKLAFVNETSARFYLEHCPNVKIDGNNDGVPCELQWCN